MLLFVLLACLTSAFQVFALASGARAISWRPWLLAFVAGMSASFVLALAAETAVLMLRAADSPRGAVQSAIRAASYGYDPAIEELCKVAPLLALAAIPRLRRALGLTDMVVLAATLGAGFAFAETALDFDAGFATADWTEHYFVLPAGFFNGLAVPDPCAAFTSWLPNAATFVKSTIHPQGATHYHVTYSLFAGLGVAVLLKSPKAWWVWLPALGYAVLDHAGFNASAAHISLPFALAPILQSLRPFDGLLALAAIVGVTIADARSRGRALPSHPALRLSAGARPEWQMLANLMLANIRKPAALAALWRFVRTRRAWLTAAQSGETGAAHLARGDDLAAFIRAIGADAVQAGPAPLTAPHKRSAAWRIAAGAAILLALPSLIYAAAIGIAPRPWMTAVFASPVVFTAVIGVLVAGLAAQLAAGVMQSRTLLDTKLRQDTTYYPATLLGLQATLGGIALGAWSLYAGIRRAPLGRLGALHAIAHWRESHPVAAMLIAGLIGALAVLLPIALQVFFPEIGFGIGVVQAITGKDILTGQKLTLLDRMLGLLPGEKSSKVLQSAERDIATGIRGVAAEGATMRTASSLQGARLNMLLAAEHVAGVRAPTSISKFSEHAELQILGRDGVGVSRGALEDAFANPLKIKYQPSRYGPTFQFVGKDATVAVNADGRVTTSWARSSAGIRR